MCTRVDVSCTVTVSSDSIFMAGSEACEFPQIVDHLVLAVGWAKVPGTSRDTRQSCWTPLFNVELEDGRKTMPIGKYKQVFVSQYVGIPPISIGISGA
jgi:hypothetical protein